MESKLAPIRVLIIFALFWQFSESAELSSIPSILLKPIMYINRMYVAPILSRPDYICIMSPQGKDKLCQEVFKQKDLVARYKMRYAENVDRNNFDYSCHLRAFNCYINNFFHLGLSQDMLLCPVVNMQSGEQVKKFFLSTNYSPDRVIVFEAGDDGRVVALVGLYDLDLDEIHKQTSTTSSGHNADTTTIKKSD